MVTHVAPRIVNDVSYVMMIKYVSHAEVFLRDRRSIW